MFKANKTVYLVRHGQSIDNASPVFQSLNSPLSKKGLSQAQDVANRVSHLKFDKLIASPVQRAKQTAETISKVTKKEIHYSDLFVERIKPTSMDGKPWTDRKAQRVWRQWEKSLVNTGMKIEDGENFDDIIKRANDALTFLENENDETIVVVSHGHFIRSMIAVLLLGDDITPSIIRNFYDLTSLENTGITVIQFREAFEEKARWRLWTLNDHAHFAE